MIGRHELKFYINLSELVQLRMRLHVVAKTDAHGTADDGYTVRSLYFDNYSDKAVVEKLSGQSNREKFRIRYYNEDISFIRLEKKSKKGKFVNKESVRITAEQCEEVLAGDHNVLKLADIPLMMELYAKIRTQNLRPRCIVDYQRQAFTYPAGNVRITLDSRVKTSNSVTGFLNPASVMIPAANTIVMEVKFNSFLPDVIRDIIQVGHRNQTEFSKYVVARLV